MSVTREEVRQTAELAKLRLEPEEIDRLVIELNGILAHAKELAEIDTTSVPAVEGAAEGAAPRRSEELGPDLLRLPLDEFALGWEDGFFTVPRLAAHDIAELEESAEVEAGGGEATHPGEGSAPGGAE